MMGRNEFQGLWSRPSALKQKGKSSRILLSSARLEFDDLSHGTHVHATSLLGCIVPQLNFLGRGGGNAFVHRLGENV